MKQLAISSLKSALSLTFGFALVLATADLPAQTTTSDDVQILVRPRATKTEAGLHAAFSAKHGHEHHRIDPLSVRVVRVPAAEAAQLLNALNNDTGIDFAEPDATAQSFATTKTTTTTTTNVTANDPYYTNGTEWYLQKIQAPTAWTTTTGSSLVIVAVVDTGVNSTHPDLVGKVLTTGYDFVNNSTDTSDLNGHGTAVAGTISPVANNALGVVGVTWASPILPVRVLDATGSGLYSNIANGIIYAADHGARIINLSLGGTVASQTLQSAVNYAWSKQCVVVAAAGNSGPSSVPSYPAACTNVVAVSATDASDMHPVWSSYGSFVTVSAPGVNIATLYGTNQYALWSGTSFSSPITAGVVALMAAANTKLTNSQLVELLIKNSDDIGVAGYDPYFGYGRVNASRAVAAAKSFVSTDTIAPVASISSPANSSTVSGTISVKVSATDKVGITQLELYVDGLDSAKTTAATGTFAVNTTTYADGVHTIQVLAYDAAGNVGTATVSVTVKNSAVADTTPPVATITSPLTGSKIPATTAPLKISVSSTDNVGVVRTDLYIDGALFGSSTANPAAFAWTTSSVATGSHTLQAYAFDAAGNYGASTLVTVTK